MPSPGQSDDVQNDVNDVSFSLEGNNAISIVEEEPAPPTEIALPSAPAVGQVPAEFSGQIPTTTAATPPASTVLFACRTTDNRVIELYDAGEFIQYVFGPQTQPELLLKVPREQTTTFQWQGIGRYESYSVQVPNGNTVYIVHWARDRLDIHSPPEGGVSIEIDGEYVATVGCATEIFNNLIGVDLPADRT